MPPAFSYPQAFARNLGWVTPAEQALLRAKRVAIAGERLRIGKSRGHQHPPRGRPCHARR